MRQGRRSSRWRRATTKLMDTARRGHIAPATASGTIIHMAIDGAYAGPYPDLRCRQAAPLKKRFAALKACRRAQDRDAHRRRRRRGASQVAARAGPGRGIQPAAPCRQGGKGGGAAEGKVPPRGSWPLWATASTTPRCCAGRTSASPWAPWAPDAAIEAADVVLMDDDPLQIAKAIKISRKCLRHRLPEHRVCHRRSSLVCLDAGRLGHRQYVAGRFSPMWAS